MVSKKVKAFIDKYYKSSATTIDFPQNDVEFIAETAEEEMKEKAIEAHWKCCPNLSKDNDRMCKHQTDCDQKCLYMTEFVNQL